MDLLKRFRGRRKANEDVVDAEKAKVISDANKILSFIRSSMSYSAVEVKELVYKLGMSEGMPYDATHGRFRGDAEKRVLAALELLKQRRAVGWGGKYGDVVCFNKRQLPGVIG